MNNINLNRQKLIQLFINFLMLKINKKTNFHCFLGQNFLLLTFLLVTRLNQEIYVKKNLFVLIIRTYRMLDSERSQL